MAMPAGKYPVLFVKGWSMDAVFVTEARFVRGADGRIYSPDVFTGSLWSRYLTRFDRILVAARIADDPSACYDAGSLAENERVSFIPLPHYIGMSGFLRNRARIKAVMKRAFIGGRAYILRVPGALGSLAAGVLSRRNIPYGVEVVGDPWDVFAPGAVGHPLRPVIRYVSVRTLRNTVKGSSAALYVTNHTLQKRYPARKDVFTVSASNVSIEGEAISAKPKTLPSSGPYRLVSVGSLAQMYKAPDVVLEAVAILGKRGVDFRLAWLGDGRYRESMTALAGSLGISDRVVFAGNVSHDRVMDTLRDSDIFILASRTEGLPRVVIEAMSCGLPCVGTKVGGIPELLNERVLVAPGNPQELAEKLAELIGNHAFAAAEAERNLRESHLYKSSVLMQRRTAFYEKLIQLSRI